VQPSTTFATRLPKVAANLLQHGSPSTILYYNRGAVRQWETSSPPASRTSEATPISAAMYGIVEAFRVCPACFRRRKESAQEAPSSSRRYGIQIISTQSASGSFALPTFRGTHCFSPSRASKYARMKGCRLHLARDLRRQFSLGTVILDHAIGLRT